MSNFYGGACSNLGGLGGFPFLGSTGWRLVSENARRQNRPDLLIVYGCSVEVGADGTVGLGDGGSAMSAAFRTVDDAGGIQGVDDSVFRDRHDAQQAALVLETARVYETHLVSHPDPLARLGQWKMTLRSSFLFFRNESSESALSKGRSSCGSYGGRNVSVCWMVVLVFGAGREARCSSKAWSRK